MNENSIQNIIISELAREPDNSTNDRNEIDDMIEIVPFIYQSAKESLGTVRIENYVEETVYHYSDLMFKSHFRMNRSTFEELLQIVGPKIQTKTITCTLQRRTLACLWYLGNTETFRSVADRFGMSKGSLHLFITQLTSALTSHEIIKKIIAWPKSTAEYEAISSGFMLRAGFPNVVGAIDGTYIPISGPSNHRDAYICRKGYPAMHLQAVCDMNLRFIDVFSAYPGSVHDARVFRNSPIFEELQRSPLPPKFHLLGDSAYPCSTSLLTPFKENGHLSEMEKKYNNIHSSTRVEVERCFGLLKGKFRKLKYLDMRKLDLIPIVIVSCCVLHNHILQHESYENGEILYEDDINSEAARVHDAERIDLSGREKRIEIMHLLN